LSYRRLIVQPARTAHVRFCATGFWLPPDERVTRKEQACIRDLIVALPEIVAAVLRHEDNQEITGELVSVEPLPLHSWAQNCHNVRIELEPSGVSSTKLRSAVAHAVKTKVLEQLTELLGGLTLPSLVVSCQPRSSSGMIVGADGHVITSWGLESGR
jgi:hypothetical protein